MFQRLQNFEESMAPTKKKIPMNHLRLIELSIIFQEFSSSKVELRELAVDREQMAKK